MAYMGPISQKNSAVFCLSRVSGMRMMAVIPVLIDVCQYRVSSSSAMGCTRVFQDFICTGSDVYFLMEDKSGLK